MSDTGHDDTDDYLAWVSTPVDPAEIVERRNIEIGRAAVSAHSNGDRTMLHARLLDDSVTLTGDERRYLASLKSVRPDNAPTRDDWALLEAYKWLIEVEGMEAPAAKYKLFELHEGRSRQRGNEADKRIADMLRHRIDNHIGDFVPSDSYRQSAELRTSGHPMASRPVAFFVLELERERRQKSRK